MNSANLASLVVRRLCHDFAGPVGAVTAALDMLSEGNDPELIALVADSAAGLSASLRLYRFALAPGREEINSALARPMFADWIKSRDGLTLDWADDGDWSAGMAELTTGLAMVAADMASRGGMLTVRCGEVRLTAPVFSMPDNLADVLGGVTVPMSTHLAIAAVLAAQAKAIGMVLRVERDTSGMTLTAYQPNLLPR